MLTKIEPSGFQVSCPFRVNSLFVDSGGSSLSAKLRSMKVRSGSLNRGLGSKVSGDTRKDTDP